MNTSLEGQIIAAYGRQFTVELPDGKHVTCVTRGKKSGAACGDRVRIALTSPDQGVIEAIQPRQSLLYRSDAFREKIIAANVTQIIIVLAAVPSFYEDLVNRCLVAAEAAKIKALIVLNKADLVAETARAMETLQPYRNLGYPLLTLCAHSDIAPLRPFLEGETSVLVGQSGMGKSSIINALFPGINLETREISKTLDSGKHTTTFAKIYHLDPDSHIIDSPGLQEFGLHHLKPEEIDHAFIEFRPYLGQCKFNNCHHRSEPGCAVLAAVEAGSIHRRRLAAFHKLVNA
ncbi:putative ribosome biogenesis GTPase RsgA [Sulfurimicrobium lacus]|uniref:Small ribosomal subunit biogenesis GTPase RsgA n=1 Tax=Sulfurimicrobium lacus TaxID=2715678 RepID=A0A6F8VD01_9PROT|nr:ribosome small subunit-dependent GTPase A [Sulfurimicrobium lacus]BCB26987.1 putative ribosome biogenesis GTPase RsgA [Sulfurimicrobium lacus]